MYAPRIILRLVAALLAAAMLCAAIGCEDQQYDWDAAEERRSQLYHTSLDTDSKVDVSRITDTDMTLPYASGDSFNPYTCQSTLTRNICYLLYDSMIQITPDFEVEYVIAKSVKIDHTIIHVQIRSGIVFSNGAPLTADDISYSYYLASRKESCYYQQLKDVTSCSVKGMTVTFMMKNEHINSFRLLDFPIVHYDPNADKNLPHIGSGRFKFATLQDGKTPDKTLLIRNNKWYNPEKVSVETISLKEYPTVESIVHSIEIGTVSYLYTDMRDGTPKNVNANYRKVDINHLLFLGMNTNDTSLADENVRREGKRFVPSVAGDDEVALPELACGQAAQQGTGILVLEPRAAQFAQHDVALLNLSRLLFLALYAEGRSLAYHS